MILFNKNDEVIYDFEGRRLVKCLLCGKIDYADNFATYGGLGQVNKGKCTECVWKMDGYKKKECQDRKDPLQITWKI